ncbi:hypothetical protein [Chlorobaculum sp. 24CR]|uniref:hypothetical protein n=1 Tax=Chlorobaculum sp. 24CR TaxID=2508878 RepID=UPI001430A33A|nr:hypothetical protein [Chlorobaculum sp. 24CR]
MLNDAPAQGVRKFIYIPVFIVCKMMGLEMVSAHKCFVQGLKSSGMAYAVIWLTAFF